MKQILLVAGLGLALTGCMTSSGWSEAPLDDRHYAVAPPVDWWGRDVASVDAFYGSLSQHGVWGNHARYGRVFLPAGVGPGWQPYARGYWRQDPRFGRLWVSSEPWGWATYHYGRWGRDDRFGWFWVPDTRFGASWVDWRDGGGYSSWSPLPPYGWSRWGYGWGNDWWVHAPGAWVYQPGLYGHVRRGRHDWDHPDRDHRDRDRHDRDPKQVVDRAPPARPLPGNVHPRSTPDRAAAIAPDKPAPTRVRADGSDRSPVPGWQGEQPFTPSQRGRHPRSAQPRATDMAVGLARSPAGSAQPVSQRSEPVARAEAPAREVRAPRAEPQARSAQPAERPMRETGMRGRDLQPNVADD